MNKLISCIKRFRRRSIWRLGINPDIAGLLCYVHLLWLQLKYKLEDQLNNMDQGSLSSMEYLSKIKDKAYELHSEHECRTRQRVMNKGSLLYFYCNKEVYKEYNCRQKQRDQIDSNNNINNSQMSYDNNIENFRNYNNNSPEQNRSSPTNYQRLQPWDQRNDSYRNSGYEANDNSNENWNINKRRNRDYNVNNNNKNQTFIHQKINMMISLRKDLVLILRK